MDNLTFVIIQWWRMAHIHGQFTFVIQWSCAKAYTKEEWRECNSLQSTGCGETIAFELGETFWWVVWVKSILQEYFNPSLVRVDHFSSLFNPLIVFDYPLSFLVIFFLGHKLSRARLARHVLFFFPGGPRSIWCVSPGEIWKIVPFCCQQDLWLKYRLQ